MDLRRIKGEMELKEAEKKETEEKTYSEIFFLAAESLCWGRPLRNFCHFVYLISMNDDLKAHSCLSELSIDFAERAKIFHLKRDLSIAIKFSSSLLFKSKFIVKSPYKSFRYTYGSRNFVRILQFGNYYSVSAWSNASVNNS